MGHGEEVATKRVADLEDRGAMDDAEGTHEAVAGCTDWRGGQRQWQQRNPRINPEN